MANKKITELPFIDTISGSSVFDNPIQNTVVPVVMYGTTNQITIENYAKFINLYSAHTGSAGNTFTGPQTINNNVTINGRLTVHELVAQYETSSILFSTGSTKLGDQLTDKHEFTGSTNITGSLFYNNVLVTNIDSNTVERLQQATASLQVQTGSQDLVNLGISTYTGSQNVINSSVDSHILTQATQTGSQDLVNNQNAIVTSSFRAEIGGIEAYTASLKGQAIVSSSTQITNYHKFAETASANTFYGNQSITGSLSISSGQFNVTTGSRAVTSSLIFTHNQSGPSSGNATLELRSNNNTTVDDISLKLIATDSGISLEYKEDGVDYSVLSVQSFDDNKLYLQRDTRVYGKGLTIDDSLLVKGVITGSILATNGVVSSSNQLFELNGQTGSQNSINFNISVVTSSIDAHILKQATQTGSQDLVNYNISVVTSSINAHILKQATQTGSQDLVNFNISVVTSSIDAHILGISTYTASANTTNTSIDAHILAQSIQTASQDLVNYNISVVTSSINAHILKQATQTGSQDLVNLGISSVTGSLIGITNGLMAFTAALDSTYATDAQLYQLYQATSSIQFATASLNTQTGSQQNLNSQIGIATSSLNTVSASLIGITNGLMAFTAALDSTYATDAQLYQLYQATSSIQFATASLNTQTGSQDLVNYNISVVTSSIDSHILKQSIQTGSQDLVNLGISTFTGSLRSEVNLIEAYTASLKGAAIVSSSTQIQNYDVFALNSNLYNGTGSIKGEIAGIEAYTASLKGAIEVSGQNVNVLGMITAQQFNVTYVSSSVMYRSGSTEFGDSSDDRHLFTGSLIVSGTLAAGTDETGWGRISFNEPTNTLRIQSSKNGTDCIPISFWSQRQGGAFSESVAISGSNMHVKSAGKLEVFRSDNTRSGSFYCDNLATIIEASTDPIRLSSPERIELYTAGVERMRIQPITSNGAFLKAANDGSTYVSLSSPYHEFNNIANSNNTIFSSTHASLNTDGVVRIDASRNTTDNSYYVLTYYNAGTGTYRFRVADSGNVTNTNGTYGTISSDRRLKENIVSATPKLDDLLKLNVVNFNLIGNQEKNIGFIAQEMKEVFPSLVYESDTRKYDENGNLISGLEDALGVKVGMEFAILTKAIQEQQTIIGSLLARIEALENK